MSTNTFDMIEDVSDPYIEHLRKKYLEKCNSPTEQTTTIGSEMLTEHESFSPLPPNPSLTTSERMHYNRAMKGLGKALKIGEGNVKTSTVNYKKDIKSSNDIKLVSDAQKQKSSINNSGINSSFMADQAVSNPTWPASLPTLPSTIPDGYKNSTGRREAISMFGSSDEHSLWWDETSTLAGLSRQIYSDSEALSISDVRVIYSELMSIYDKLQKEKGRIADRQILEDKLEVNFNSQEKELAIREAFLLEKEKELLERERALSLNLQNFKGTKEIVAKLEGVELEVQEKIDLMQQSHQLEIERLNSQLLEKNRELKRLRNSLNTFKEQNDTLRDKFDDVKSEYGKGKILNCKLKKRFENLQRRQDFRAFKPLQNLENENPKTGREHLCNHLSISSDKVNDKETKSLSGIIDALLVAFDWLLEVHAERNDSKSNERTINVGKEYIVDKCLKVLPLLVDVIKILPSYLVQKKHLSFLSFIYLCLCRVDESQNALLSTTTRRLGEELYKSSALSRNSHSTSASLILATTAGSVATDSFENIGQNNDTKPFRAVYFRSSNSEIRLICSLIILKTLHQVDVLGHVFGQVKKDLKDENNRMTFLRYNASNIILPYITYRANKALMGDAVDVVLQMSMESSLLPDFLDQCSNEQWFRAFSSALRSGTGSLDKSASINSALIEKLSIVLQKLSKIKSNRKFFDAFSMGHNLQECYRSCDPKNTFLTLNLRSILFNLNMLKESVK